MLFQECKKCNKILTNEAPYALTENGETFVVCKCCYETTITTRTEQISSLLLEG